MSPEGEFILVYRHPDSGKLIVKKAADSDLLALKLIAEEMVPEMAAKTGEVSLGVIGQVINEGVRNGILLKPQARIRRPPSETFAREKGIDNDFLVSDFFTLPWHITQKCDLHCCHCYDRSDRTPLPLKKGLKVLDDLQSFCRSHFVRGQVSFSGGNLLLYPGFMDLYEAAVERGLQVAILGNPTDRKTLAEMIAIKPPVIGLKDNLFNIIKKERALPLFGGCAGYGCGAAFNFLSLLPDGEVHACRKLPSLLGNIFTTSLQDIYDSDFAERYRQGSTACRGCEIRLVCGGCPWFWS